MRDLETLIRTAPPLAVKLAGNAGEIVGYASTFGGEPDSYGDIIAPGAFAKSLADLARRGESPLMLWAHDTTAPIGRWVELKEDGRGLMVRGVLNLETSRGHDAHAHLKAGDVSGLSVGFRSPPGSIDHNGDGTQTLREIELREISVVTMPANRSARVVGVKSIGSQRELQSLLHESGLPRAAAAKVAAAGWPALSNTETPDVGDLLARVKAASLEIRNLKG